MPIWTARWARPRRWGGWDVRRRLGGGGRLAANGGATRDMCVSITWDHQQRISKIGHSIKEGYKVRINSHLQYCALARKRPGFGHSQHLFGHVLKCNPRRTRLHSHL